MLKTPAHPGRGALCALVALIVTVMLFGMAGALVPHATTAPVLLVETVSLRTASGAPVALPAEPRPFSAVGAAPLSLCALGCAALALAALRLSVAPAGPRRAHALTPFSPVLRI